LIEERHNMEYYGKCPKCGSFDVETLDTYKQPASRGNEEVRYICKCNSCGEKFDISENDNK
jgi:hypothetical protein